MRKILFLALTLIFYASPVISLGTEEGCGEEGECIEGDCDTGIGTYIFTDGSSYTGAWRDGFPEGTGTLKYNDGTEFKGKWKSGSYFGEDN